MIRFDEYMVERQDRYWIETNADWTLVHENNKNNNTKTSKDNSQIATRFEIYANPQFHCASTQPLYTTESAENYIIFETGFDMKTGKSYDKNITTFENEKLFKVPSEDNRKQQNNKNTTNNPDNYYGLVNKITHLEMQMDLYMSKNCSQLSLQAIEFFSTICDQTRKIRQLIITQVHKDIPLLGYILPGDRSIFVQQKGINLMKMFKCA